MDLLKQFEDSAVDVGGFPFRDDDVIAFSRFVFLRREATKLVFIVAPHLDISWKAIRPEQGILLALFDGTRSVLDVARIVSKVHGAGLVQALEFVKSTMAIVTEDYKAFSVLSNLRFPAKQFDWTAFGIPGWQVDLGTRLEAPLSIELQVTDRCHTNCSYCYAEHTQYPPSDFLTLGEIEGLFEESRHLGVAQFNLCGGDPMCRAEIADIVAMGNARGLVMDLSTSAHVPVALARQLALSGLDWVQVSVDSHDPGISDVLYGVPGHHARVCQTIENFLNAGIFTRTNSIITKRNFEGVDKLVAFIHGFGIRDMKISPAMRSYFRDNSAEMLSFSEIAELDKRVAILKEEYAAKGLRVNYGSLPDHTQMSRAEKEADFPANQPMCGGGRMTMIIDPVGHVRLCEQAPCTEEFFVGNVRRQSIKEVWDSERLLGFVRPEREAFGAYACRDCDQFSYCMLDKGQCFVDALKVYGSRFAPNPKCAWAPVVNHRIN